MALGATLACYTNVTGDTDISFTKIRDGVYRRSNTDGDGKSSTMLITLKPSTPVGAKRKCQMTLEWRPDTFDAPGSQTRGRLKVSIDVEGTIGSECTQTLMATWAIRFASLLARSEPTDDLLLGSTE